MPDRPDLFDEIFGLPDDDGGGMPRQTRPQHPMPCPPLIKLMAYADENDTSLTPRRRERIRQHVYCCETCFMFVERVDEDVLHDVREMLIADHDFNQEASRRRAANFQQALHVQIKRNAPPLGSPHPVRHWLPIAAMAAAIVVGVLLLRPATVVIHAEELIERAIAYERDHTMGSRRRVRESLSTGMMALGRALSGKPAMTSFFAIRDVVDGAYAAELRLVTPRERETHAELARLLEKYHYDARKPFCMTCYGAWRASLTRKHDTLTVTGDIVQLRTMSFEGDLREVTLSFNRDSNRLVRQALLFQSLGLVVVEELERQAAPANQRAPASHGVTDGGAGPLASSVTNRPPAAGDQARMASRPAALSRWLDRTFLPSNTARASFLPNIERRSAAVRQHLVALQRLANISDSARLKNGSDADRAKLKQQVELEYQAMVTHLRVLEDSLTLLLGTATRAAEIQTPVPADWQRRASMALPHVTRLQHRLRRIFTQDDLPYEETQPFRPRSARAAFEALWASIHGNPRDGLD